MAATAIKPWLAQRGVQTLYIDAGKPWQNGKSGRSYSIAVVASGLYV